MDKSKRCDSCGAQGQWITYIHDTEMIWCAHHFTEYEVKLRATADLVLDDRESWCAND